MDGTNNAVIRGTGLRPNAKEWTFTAGEPLQQASIAQGTIYVSGDGGRLGDPSDDRIYALNAATGAKIWSRRLDNMSMTTPVVARGLVFVGAGNQQFTSAQQARVLHLASRHVLRGTGPCAVYALNARTGRIVWKYATQGEDMPSAVYHRGVVYAATGGGHVYAFHARGGGVLWKRSIGSYVSMSSPALSGGMLYVSGAHPYNVYALNARSGRVAWSVGLPGVFAGSDDCSVAVTRHHVFVEGTTGSWTHPASVLFALKKNGQLAWQRKLGSGSLPKDIEVSAPMVHGGTVYIGSPLTDTEYALSTQDGRLLWSFQAAGPISESAAEAGGRLYVGDGKGMLYALNARTGKELAARYFSGAFAADYPVIEGQTVFQPDENGQMFAVPLQTLTSRAMEQPANLPMPSGALGRNIAAGENVFMSGSLDPSGQSCASCHADAGTQSNYRNGTWVPSLLGTAASFPALRDGRIRSLDGQINGCIKSMGGKPLSHSDPRMQALNLYMHWLSSGWPEHVQQISRTGAKTGGC